MNDHDPCSSPGSSFGVDAAALASLVEAELRGSSAAASPFGGLEAWRHRLDSILRIISDGVVVLDFTGAVAYANPPTYRMLGLPETGAILGRDLAALYAETRILREDGAELPAAELPGRPPFRGEEPGEQLVSADSRDGRRRWLVTRTAPIWDVERRPVAVVLVFSDVTAHRRIEEVNRALSEADRNKDEFLAVLAHELRNPLASMLSSAELLRAERREDDLDELLPILERQARHLARLVDDLLDVSRMTHGKIALRVGRVELSTILADAIEDCAVLREERAIELVLDHGEEPRLLDADRLRLAQVFGNIIHNAVKHSPRGGRIHVGARSEGQRVVVTVRDEGNGIDAELLPRVFDLFAQRRDEISSGLGVGLHLARALVELHGGVIEARSEGRGRGTQVIVSLPLADAEAQIEPAPAPPAAAPIQRDVLLVDDDLAVTRSLAWMLRRLGCETRVANDGPRALALVKARAPDLVILDLNMPGMSGYDVARELRSLGLPSTRIVALSGYGQDADRRRSEEAGFDQHLTKPITLSELRALVARAEPIDR